MNYTNTLFFHNLHSIRVFNTCCVEKFLKQMRKQEIEEEENGKKINRTSGSTICKHEFCTIKKNVDQAVDKSVTKYGDISCLKNPTNTIQCKGKNFYSSNETYELNLKYKESCYYYRYSDEGYWNIELSFENNGQKSKILDSSGYDFNVLSLNEFKINYFTEGQPFQINILKTDDVVTGLKVQKLTSWENNFCKPGSALTDDLCQKTSFSIVTEEHLFRNMECFETVK